jgi:hypothetical protein
VGRKGLGTSEARGGVLEPPQKTDSKGTLVHGEAALNLDYPLPKMSVSSLAAFRSAVSEPSELVKYIGRSIATRSTWRAAFRIVRDPDGLTCFIFRFL